jgi:ribbon-helix-helix CopG family protein
MRTTVTLDKDVAAAVERLRRREGIGMSAALNRIARAGLANREARKPYRQRSVRMGPFRVDVSNVGDALEVAESPDHR